MFKQGIFCAIILGTASANAQEVLFLQPFCDDQGVLSQIFPNRGFDRAQAADDFEVPANELWDITSVTVEGFYAEEPPSGPLQDARVIFYEDDDGEPGRLACSSNNADLEDPQNPSFEAMVSPTCTLEGGVYWVSVMAEMSDSVGGTWFWRTSFSGFGSNFHWRDPDRLVGGSFSCTLWQPGFECPGVFIPNLCFVLSGSSETTASQTPLHVGFTGAWFDPSHDGEGFLIEILPDSTALVYWFTYDRFGEQAWIAGLGSAVNNTIVITDALIFQGGEFGPDFDPNTVESSPWGEMTFTFSDCDNGEMTYSGPAEFGSGGQQLTRITNVRDLGCSAVKGTSAAEKAVSDGNFSGAWFDPTHDGEGFLIDILPGDQALVYWFTYDVDGNQAWIGGVGEINGSRITMTEPNITSGGIFGDDFDPETVVLRDWGTVEFNFTSCDTGFVEYSGENPFGSGTQDLVRLTSLATNACTFPAE